MKKCIKINKNLAVPAVGILIAGLALVAGSLLAKDVYAGALLGILAFACFWSIRELFEQERRVEKGWFPKNEKRKKQ